MAANQQPRDYQAWAAIDATPNDFYLNAGAFGLTLAAVAWGTATLQQLQADGTTYIAVAAAIGADGYNEFHLPSGRYRLLLAGITDLTGNIAKIASG
jgi:hypothetical protein